MKHLAPNKNFGGGDSLTIRSFSNDPSNRYTAYVRFDQTTIANHLGGGVLDSARLEFYLRDGGNWPTGGDLLNAYRIPNSWAPGGWTEMGITANCPNDTNTSNAALNCPGGVWDTTGFGAMTPTSQVTLTNDTRNWISFNVTADVNAFVGGTPNHGWYIAKQNNNNNERIVFWSRESSLQPRLILWVSQEASDTSEVAVTLDKGILGAPGDGIVSGGTGAISYSYSAAPGYGHLQVQVDGVDAPDQGQVSRSSSHVITVSASRIEAPAGTEGIANSARALLTAGDPVSAYQQHINIVANYLSADAGPDRVLAVTEAYDVAWDLPRDAAALNQLESALSGHVFDIPISNGNNAQADSVQPTFYVYVNGISTDSAAASITATGQLLRVLSTEPFFNAARDSVKLLYNRTFPAHVVNETTDQKQARCILTSNSPGLGKFMKKYQACLNAPPQLQPADFIEAANQYVALGNGIVLRSDDAVTISNALTEWVTRGINVIFVPHSQGNMMVQEGIGSAVDSDVWFQGRDSMTIAAVPLAAPLQSGWPLDSFLIKPISLTGDIVADNPFLNGFRPTLGSPLHDSLEARFAIASGIVGSVSPTILVQMFIQHGKLLHQVDRAYFGQASVAAVIQDSLREAHEEVTAGSLRVPTHALTILNGVSLRPDLGDTVKNQNGRRLYARRAKYRSDNPSVVSVDSTGTLTTHGLGTANVIVAYRTVADTVQVSVQNVPPHPDERGIWQSVGNSILAWPDECTGQLEIRTITGPVAEQLDCGTGWHSSARGYSWTFPGACRLYVHTWDGDLAPAYSYCLDPNETYTELVGGYYPSAESILWPPSYFDPNSDRRPVQFVRVASYDDPAN